MTRTDDGQTDLYEWKWVHPEEYGELQQKRTGKKTRIEREVSRLSSIKWEKLLTKEWKSVDEKEEELNNGGSEGNLKKGRSRI